MSFVAQIVAKNLYFSVNEGISMHLTVFYRIHRFNIEQFYLWAHAVETSIFHSVEIDILYISCMKFTLQYAAVKILVQSQAIDIWLSELIE
jgi:hypothetical protein